MTHDELLMRLWEKRNALCDNLDVHFALSAVVELHKDGNGEASRCEACCVGIIDCPTIQAIERELS